MKNNTVKNNKKRASLICDVISILLIVLVLAVGLPLGLPSLFGYRAYDVISGSMEPEIRQNSIVYCKDVNPVDIVEDDVIVFYSSDETGAITTHRVVENQVSEETFVTKGDANEQNDVTPVYYSDLIGKVTLSVPILGGILSILTTATGKIALFAVIGAAVLLHIAGLLLGRKTDASVREEEKQEDS